jgi:hypothetical protein
MMGPAATLFPLISLARQLASETPIPIVFLATTIVMMTQDTLVRRSPNEEVS